MMLLRFPRFHGPCSLFVCSQLLRCEKIRKDKRKDNQRHQAKENPFRPQLLRPHLLLGFEAGQTIIYLRNIGVAVALALTMPPRSDNSKILQTRNSVQNENTENACPEQGTPITSSKKPNCLYITSIPQTSTPTFSAFFVSIHIFFATYVLT